MSQITTNITNAELGDIITLTGNSGGAVGPTAGNVNILGGTGITVAGNPGTSTLTLNLTGVSYMTYTGVSTSPYVVLNTDDFIGVTTSSIPITIELPNAPVTGRVWTVKDVSGLAGTNNVTVTTVGGIVLIDGAATFVMNTAWESITVLFNGSAYLVF